jgi:hypothetical protein
LADPLDVLRVRADVRGYLVAVGEWDLHDAVDVLQAYAVESGLIDEIGQDAVQAIMADAFALVTS